MDVASTAADLIKSGGPAGAGVVPIFFVASKARRAYTGADSDQKPWMRAIEVLSWLTGLAMIVYSVVYFVHRDPSQVVRGSLRGSLKYLDGSQSLWAMGENDPVYIGNHDSRGLTTKTVTWAIIGPKISPGTSIPFLITGRQGGPDLVFDMPVQSDFYDGEPVDLLVAPQKVTLKHGKTTSDLPLSRPVTWAPNAPPSAWWAPVSVHAQSKPMPPTEIIILLEVDDPNVRRNARDALANSGTDALDAIDGVAKDPHRSYRAWLGAMSALNRISSGAKVEPTPAMIQAMVDSLSSADTDVSIIVEVEGYMVAHASEKIETALSAQLASRTAKGAAAKDLYALVDTFFGVFYNLGIADKDRYKGPDKTSQDRFMHAVARFDEAWRLRTRAAPYNVPEYPKALYGWALTLKDRAYLDAKAGKGTPAETAAARDKFQEFLNAVQQDDVQKTPYPAKYAHQIKEAKSYLESKPIV